MDEQLRRTAVGATVSMDRCVDELTRRIQSKIELKTGFAEPHQMSRELQRLFKAHDTDGSGTMSEAEFARVLGKIAIGGTPAEHQALFERFDLSENGLLTFAEFSDGVFGVRSSPLGDPVTRSVLDRFKARVLQRGGTEGTRGLSRGLRVMDRDRSGVLSREELETGMQRLGCAPRPGEMDAVMKAFDRDGNGGVTVGEFLRAVRGKMNPRRTDMVHQAFRVLDRKQPDGTVRLSELAEMFDASQHPEVLKGTRSAEDVLKEFAGAWDKDGDGCITLSEFEEYYKDLSAGIDSDDYFELMVRNAWHISGGEGWCANTTNRRVLVILRDGSQHVVEIKDDLGIGAADVAKMKANLLRRREADLGFPPSEIKTIRLTA
eukprot:Hpha_TRINITY_DN1528_c0_g1::TRINITY_DN1528_c0_g1_i2::g.57215::m.57215